MKNSSIQKRLYHGLICLALVSTGCASSPETDNTSNEDSTMGTPPADTIRLAPGEGSPVSDTASDTIEIGTTQKPARKDSVLGKPASSKKKPDLPVQQQ